tara:strand:+ start:75 stop:740 length:666 start_codon:yes stop_codon:yes gene_type:complete
MILSLVLLASCGPSWDEKRNIAINACSIMGETKKSEAVIRLQTMSDAREKIGGETYIRGDDAIIEAFELGVCQQLVLNEDYEWYRNVARQSYVGKKKIAAEKRAEEQRIADSKPTVKEEFYSSGKLKSRANHQPKNDGGKKHGLSEWYRDNGQLEIRRNYKDGKQNGLYETYYENGQLEQKGNYKDGKRDGLMDYRYENGRLQTKICFKNSNQTNMSYCEK